VTASVDTAAQFRSGSGKVASLDDVLPAVLRGSGLLADVACDECCVAPAIPPQDRRNPVSDLGLARDDRPAPAKSGRRIQWQFGAFITGSLFAHVALCAVLNSDPEPLATAGEEAISVEIIVGSNTTAGIAEVPIKSDVENPLSVEAAEPEEPKHQRAAKVEPLEQVPESPLAIANVEKRTDDSDTRTEEPGDAPVEVKTPQAPSVPSSGIGHGWSAADAKYFGRVAAHLAQRKQYPLEARRKRQQGTGTVSFTIGATGQVESVEIVRGTGASTLDREIEAMVRRAAPFPPPPSGTAVNFTTPISFHLNNGRR
jgi:TonB family protein